MNCNERIDLGVADDIVGFELRAGLGNRGAVGVQDIQRGARLGAVDREGFRREVVDAIGKAREFDVCQSIVPSSTLVTTRLPSSTAKE